jgi:hypothetical protein
MPKFEIVNKEEAQSKSRFGGKNGQIIAMYMFFIEQLKENKAGKLKATEGETIQAVRRRLGKAAKLTGKNITIKRVNDEVYFWLESESKPSSRKRKTANVPTRSSNKSSSQNVSNMTIQTKDDPEGISQGTPQNMEGNLSIASQEKHPQNEDGLIIQWKERIEESNEVARRNLQMSRRANSVKPSG